MSPVNATSSWEYDSEIRVAPGWVASFAKPFPFLRSSRLRFGCGLVGCSSSSSLGVGVGAAISADDGAACGDGERRLEGEAAGWPLEQAACVGETVL